MVEGDEPFFLSREDVCEIHYNQVMAYGGAAELLDEGLLESALARPQNAYLYGDSSTTLFHLAAAYAFHIWKNHPFADGNKRVGIACAIAFLDVNGWLVEGEVTNEMLELVTDQMSKDEFAAVLKDASRRKFTRWALETIWSIFRLFR